MKVPRTFVGKMVEVVWRDPGSWRYKVAAGGEAPRGMIALATWRERGVLSDITDGVLRIDHSEGYEPIHNGGREDKGDEFYSTFVHEALIPENGIRVFAEIKEAPRDGGV